MHRAQELLSNPEVKVTQRERDYLSAIATIFENQTVSLEERAQQYEKQMEDIYKKYGDAGNRFFLASSSPVGMFLIVC